MLKYKYTSDEGELFLNQLAVYGTSLAKGSIQQQLSELERTIKNFSDINYRDRNIFSDCSPLSAVISIV